MPTVGLESQLNVFRKLTGSVVWAVVLVLAYPAAAETGCAAFPKVSFWGTLTHESVIKLVDDSYVGAWGTYVAQLERQLKTLREIQGRGSGVVIKRNERKIKLAGNALAEYIGEAGKRLAVVRCLADKLDLDGLNRFSTAAGTPEPTAGTKPNSRADSGIENATYERTYISLPKTVLAKLRGEAVRRSTSGGKVSVNDIVVEILDRELSKRDR